MTPIPLVTIGVAGRTARSSLPRRRRTTGSPLAVERYRSACAGSRDIVGRCADLAQRAAGTGPGRSRRDAGHLDILREHLDGATGR